MKKVKCINKIGWEWKIPRYKRYFFGLFKGKKNNDVNGPKYNDVVTVEKQEWSCGQLYYYLVEWPNDGNHYNSKGFTDIEVEEAEFEKVTFEKISKDVPISVQ